MKSEASSANGSSIWGGGRAGWNVGASADNPRCLSTRAIAALDVSAATIPALAANAGAKTPK
jgi:hypothetical protein